MTKRTRILLAGAVVVLLAFIPGSAGADTASLADPASLDNGSKGAGCPDADVEAPVSLT